MLHSYSVASVVVCRRRMSREVLWQNGASYSKSYYCHPIESRIWEIDWYQNEWPWPLFRGRIKVMSNHCITIRRWISRKPNVRDGGLVPKERPPIGMEMAYGLSNGHVSDRWRHV